MGGDATLVEWCSRHVRLVVSGSRAVAGGGGEASAFESHGSGNDILNSAELFLCGRHVGYVVDRVDLGQHRSRFTLEKEFAGAKDRGSCAGGVERRRSKDVEHAAAAGCRGATPGGSLLLRLVAAS